MKSLKFALLVASAFFQMAHADDIDAGRVPIGVTRLPEYAEPAPAHEPEVTAAPSTDLNAWNSGGLMQNNSQFNQAPNVTSGSGSYSSGTYKPASTSASAAPSAPSRRPASVSDGSTYSAPDFEYSGISGIGFDTSAVNRPASARYDSSGHTTGGNSAYAAQQAALQAQHDQALAAQQQAAEAATQGTRSQFLRAGRNGGTVEQAAADEAAELARRQAELEARQRAIQATLQNENR
jgi:hypothetical protein